VQELDAWGDFRRDRWISDAGARNEKSLKLMSQLYIVDKTAKAIFKIAKICY